MLGFGIANRSTSNAIKTFLIIFTTSIVTGSSPVITDILTRIGQLITKLVGTTAAITAMHSTFKNAGIIFTNPITGTGGITDFGIIYTGFIHAGLIGLAAVIASIRLMGFIIDALTVGITGLI